MLGSEEIAFNVGNGCSQFPLVSVTVLSYNQAHFILECLESIKAQQYPNMELIIHDDASRDDSVEIIDSWLGKCDIPHRFLKSRVNRGICRSLNNILSHVRGKYVSGIAADDVWLPNKLFGQVRMMEQLPARVGVIYSDAMLIDEDGKLLPGKFSEDGRCRNFKAMPEGDVHLALWQDNFIAPMTILMKRECYERVGIYDENLFAEDWDMWLRISRHYDFIFSPEITVKYRIVGTSATRANFGRLVDDMCKTCLKHLQSGQLTAEAHKMAAKKLHSLASCSFDQKSTLHTHNLLMAMKYRPTAGILARLLLSGAGCNPELFKRARSVVCRVLKGSGAVVNVLD